MAYYNLTGGPTQVTTGKDGVTIPHNGFDIPGGRTIDINGYTEGTVQAGHVVIKDENEKYKLLPVSGGAYVSLPAQHSYAGIVRASFAASKPAASILIDGGVSEGALPYPITQTIKDGLKGINFF